MGVSLRTYLLTSDNPSNMRHDAWAGQQGSKNGHEQLPFKKLKKNEKGNKKTSFMNKIYSIQFFGRMWHDTDLVCSMWPTGRTVPTLDIYFSNSSKYSADFQHGPRFQCWCMSPIRLSTAAVAAHPNKTFPLLWACGTDGRLAWPVQGLTYVRSRATQGLEAPSRTSASHLASDPGSRPSAAQSWPELSMATRPGHRTLEAARGNGYTLQSGACPWWWWVISSSETLTWLVCSNLSINSLTDTDSETWNSAATSRSCNHQQTFNALSHKNDANNYMQTVYNTCTHWLTVRFSIWCHRVSTNLIKRISRKFQEGF